MAYNQVGEDIPLNLQLSLMDNQADLTQPLTNKKNFLERYVKGNPNPEAVLINPAAFTSMGSHYLIN